MTPAEFFRSHGACEEACKWLENFVNIRGAWRYCTDSNWMLWVLHLLNVEMKHLLVLDSERIERFVDYSTLHQCRRYRVYWHGITFCCSTARRFNIKQAHDFADVIRQHIPVETVIKAYVEAGGK